MNENKSEKHMLGELLAVLNGDGGHYAVEHGVEAAFKRGLERHYAALAAAEGGHDDRLKQQTDWYQQRFNALREWVNREVRPLSEEAAHRYFAIVANGAPSPHERADWRETMHGLTLRAEKAERGRDACAASRQLILEMYEEAVKERDLARAQATIPKPRTSGTGMCPYCGQPAGSSGCQRSHP